MSYHSRTKSKNLSCCLFSSQSAKILLSLSPFTLFSFRKTSCFPSTSPLFIFFHHLCFPHPPHFMFVHPFHFQLSSLPSSMHFYPFALQSRLKETELNLLGSCQDFVNAYMCADAKPLPKGICEFNNVIKLSHTPAYRARPGLQLSSHTTANILFVRNAERLSLSSWSKEKSYYHTAPQYQQLSFGLDFCLQKLHFIQSFHSLLPR